MTIGRKIYDIGQCPSPGKQKGKEFRTPVAISQEYDADTNRITVTVYMLREGMNPPDKIYDLYMCPQGQSCGCYYPTDVGWEIDETLCQADVSWTWPEAAGCMIKSGSLTGSKSGLHFTEELAEDPDWEIYSRGDIRNPECPGCGMSGANRDTTVETPVPGEQFSLSACIDEETCLGLYGAGGCHPIGSERFQTVGFMGGRIAVTSDNYSTISIWVQNILNANSTKNFVQRILYPELYPTLQLSEEEYATHLMAWSDYGGGYIVYPTVVCDDLDNCTGLTQLDDTAAFNFALVNGEYIYFSSAGDADLFSMSYKVVWLADEWFDENGDLFADAYLVDVCGESIPCWSTDKTEYEVNDWVALAKIGTEFPVDEFEHRVAVTNSNVPTVDEYIILPFAFQGL